MSHCVAVIGSADHAAEVGGLLDAPWTLHRDPTADIAADCRVLIHQPPEYDALAQLRSRSSAMAIPEPVLVIQSDVADTQTRYALLRAGAMEVLSSGLLNRETLNDALYSARARFAASSQTGLDAKLHEQEQRLVLHLENSPLAAVEWDADFRCIRWTKRAEAMFGWRAEDVTGLRIGEWEFIPEDDRAAVSQIMSNLTQGREAQNISSNRNIRRDGTQGHFEWYNSVRFDAAGQLISVLSLVLDVSERHRAEEDLRHTTSLLRAVTDTAVDPIFAKNATGQMLLVNPAALQMIGKAANEVMGRTALEWLGDNVYSRMLMENDHRVMSSGKTEEVEEVLPTSRGLRTFLAVKSPLRDDSGRVTGLVGIRRDITDSKKAAEALRASEALAQQAAARADAEKGLLDAVLEAAPVGVIVADAQGKLLRTNAANELLWGTIPYSQSIDEYREWKGWWADQSARRGQPLDAHDWAMARALRGEVVRKDLVEVEPFDKPNSRRTIINSGAPVRDQEGRIIGAVVAQMDITDLIKAEDALRESEIRFRALADNISQLAWIADASGEVIWVNQRWSEYTGTTLQQVGRWQWQSLHHPDRLAGVVEKFTHHIRTGLPWEDTFPLRGRDGDYRWFLSRAVPLRDDSGQVTRWFGTNTDITDQRRAEDALREADQRKDEFIAMLAHELRNPLAPVRSAVQMLQKSSSSEPAQLARARDIINRQVAHMSRLIDDLLDVSRIARGKLELQKEVCDFAVIARETAEDYRASLEAAGLSLKVTSTTGPLWVECDPVRIAQMIGNYLQNAGRFTESGGKIEVRLEEDSLRQAARIVVEDNGSGIDPALLAHLFDAFRQADQGLARSKGGLGLGLALTKGLAQLHGGQVTAESAGAGKGAIFTLSLPLTQRRHEQASNLSAAQPFTGRRILIVEDNQDAAETLGLLLELVGHEVKLAFDGSAALPAAREFRPEVVISDIGLPGDMDGYAVARALREEPVFENLWLIALSGYADEESRRRSAASGFDLHLAKPVDFSALESTLAQIAPGQPHAQQV